MILRACLPILAIIALFFLPVSHVRADDGRPLQVFAAASLTDVLKDIATSFEAETGTRANVTVAGTSILARQIALGAPADVFLSAHTLWMDWLLEQNAVDTASKLTFAHNRLVIATPYALKLSAFEKKRFREGIVAQKRTLSIPDPDHVPAGLYAREALQSLALYEALLPYVIRTENVRQTLVFLRREEITFGIVYQSDLRGLPDRVRSYYTFEATTHSPISYLAGRVSGSTHPQAGTFNAFLLSAKGQEIFCAHGFLPAKKTEVTNGESACLSRN